MDAKKNACSKSHIACALHDVGILMKWQVYLGFHGWLDILKLRLNKIKENTVKEDEMRERTPLTLYSLTCALWELSVSRHPIGCLQVGAPHHSKFRYLLSPPHILSFFFGLCGFQNRKDNPDPTIRLFLPVLFLPVYPASC